LLLSPTQIPYCQPRCFPYIGHGGSLFRFKYRLNPLGTGIEILIVPSGLNSTEQSPISINQCPSPIGLLDDDGRTFSLPD
jgi:hypothetical protein